MYLTENLIDIFFWNFPQDYATVHAESCGESLDFSLDLVEICDFMATTNGTEEL